MRTELAKKYGNRIKVYGTFEKFGQKFGWKGNIVKTILLLNIRDKTGKILTDHLWFNYTKSFEKIKDLQPGDLLRFEATVTDYVKGYEKDQLDYKLARPTKVVKIHSKLFRETKKDDKIKA